MLLLIAQWPAVRETLSAAVRLRRGSADRKDSLWLSNSSPRTFPHEPGLVIGGGAILILLFCYPSFSGFFIAEDFTYLGNYQAAGGRFLAGILTPINHIFFRPSAAAWYLFFNSFLPTEAWAHHLRNFLTTTAAAALLYALTRRLFASPFARGTALAIFAVSKIHLTTIGYINCNDSIMGLIQVEATLYLLILYFETAQPGYLYASYVPYTLEVFSRDYGVVVIAVVATAMLVQTRRTTAPWTSWLRRMAPFVAIAAIYFLIRVIVLQGETPRSDAYAIRIDPVAIAYRIWVFAGNLFNVSLASIEVSGHGSFVTIIQQLAPSLIPNTKPWEMAFALLSGLFVCAISAAALRRDPRLWIAVVWIGAFIGPSFLIGNIQMYYALEPLAGFALLIAGAVDALDYSYMRRTAAAWVLVISVNTAVESRFITDYSWRFCADAARRVYVDAIRPHIGEAVRSWTLLVPEERQIPFWSYTLTADDTCPLIATLLRQPGARIKISGMKAFKPADLRSPDEPVYMVSQNRVVRLLPSTITSTVPAGVQAGATFNVQPDGSSALWVNCENALPTTVVHWNGEPLQTAIGSSRAVSALVPARMLARPGVVEITLHDSQTGIASPAYELHVAEAARATVSFR